MTELCICLSPSGMWTVISYYLPQVIAWNKIHEHQKECWNKLFNILKCIMSHVNTISVSNTEITCICDEISLILQTYTVYYRAYMYTEQNYKRNTFVLPPFFMSWTQRSKTFLCTTKDLFLSNIVHKSVLICVSEHFSFAEIIHPPHRCGISRCWLDSMIIAQVCLRLATIKGHSKMCSFITQHNATDVASF